MFKTIASFMIVLLLLCLTWVAPSSFAQQTEDAPNYRLQVFGSELSDDRSQIIVQFGVSNIGGGDATQAASVIVRDLSTGREIASADGIVRALEGRGDTESNLSIAFPVNLLPSGSNQVLNIEVGVGEIESNDSPTIFNNSVSITVEVPVYESVVIEPGGALVGSTTSVGNRSSIITIPGLDLDIDTADTEQMTIVAGIIVSGLAILAIILLILRLLFQRSPTFGNWQPPYATMPPLDANSTFGRRQMWQQHATNNIVPSPCTMGNIHARKLLLGMDDVYLSGWKISALRLSQYDMYGRVSRSQVLARRGVIRRLDRIAHRAPSLTVEKIARRTRPIARRLSKQLNKRIKKRGANLPIALDVRIKGRHGEVRIVFELYECRSNSPFMLDNWEPEMTVLGKTIYESYTFTIYGQAAGRETLKTFRQRLSDDIERVLTEFLRTGTLLSALNPALQTDENKFVSNLALDTASGAPTPPDVEIQTVEGEWSV